MSGRRCGSTWRSCAGRESSWPCPAASSQQRGGRPLHGSPGQGACSGPSHARARVVLGNTPAEQAHGRVPRHPGHHGGHFADPRGRGVLPSSRRCDSAGVSRLRPRSAKFVLPSVIDNDSYRLFPFVIGTSNGRSWVRFGGDLLGRRGSNKLQAARRKMMEYHHADRLNYAVTGTPNRLEYDRDYVSFGDGAADVKTIAHLYKTQVYQLAAHLGLPAEIQSRAPTTTSSPCRQSRRSSTSRFRTAAWTCASTERTTGSPSRRSRLLAGLTEQQVSRVYRDIDQKRRSTEYLHLPPQTVSEVPECLRGDGPWRV